MNTIRSIFTGNARIDFPPIWKRTLPVSFAAMVISALLLLVVGLNLSIEFSGGGIFEVPVAESVSVDDARDALSDKTARVQKVRDQDGGNFIRVQTSTEATDNAALASEAVIGELAELGGVTLDDVTRNQVGPTWGDQITAKAVRALVAFFAVVALYLAWRLEWRMAIGALVAVVHDLLITAGIYSIVRFEVSPATVIALLTIMGYSLYDTVVVYDKVLERETEPGAWAQGYTPMLSRSVNQVLMRSINTTITTVLPVLSMLVIGAVLLGGATLRDFSLALFIGLLLGTYSSVFVAAPVLAWLKERQPDIAEERLKRERRVERKSARS